MELRAGGIFLLWLGRPILESFIMTVLPTGGVDESIVFIATLAVSSFFFLLLLFSSVLGVSVSSKVSRPSITAPLQTDLSLARVSQEFVWMFMFMDR